MVIHVALDFKIDKSFLDPVLGSDMQTLQKCDKKNLLGLKENVYLKLVVIASEESFLLSMGDPKNAIKSLILVVEQFCIKHFLILFQF